MPEGRRPALSAIVPLVDPRGLVLDCIAAWTRQRDARDRVEVVVVGEPAADLTTAIRGLLRPSDQIVSATGRNEAVLYNAGVAAARAELLVLTESHCLPEPDTAAELLRSFAATDFDVACLGSLHLSPNRLARQEERLHEQRVAGRDAATHWGDVSLRGLAVRRSLLAELGGLDESCERFAETVLGIELWRRGLRIVNAEKARVRHANCRTFTELGSAVRALARGQCAWRARVGPELAEPWLGVAASGFADWPERARLSRRHARQALAVALRSLVLDRGRPGHGARATALRGEIRRLLGGALWGARGAWLGATLQAWAGMAGFHLTPGEGERLSRRHRAIWQSLMRRGALEYMLAHPLPALVPGGEPPSLRPGDLPDGSLLGFYRRETSAGKAFRWSLPLALLPLALPGGRYRIRLEGWSPRLASRCPRVYLDAMTLGPEQIEIGEHCVAFTVEVRPGRNADEHLLALTCAPFPAAAAGFSDPRPLGIAVERVVVEPAAAGS
jgi:GT2 family glycosyltransferase